MPTDKMEMLFNMRGVSRWLLMACLAMMAVQSGSTQETRVVCYYTNWSVYRPGTAKFGPQNINPYLCTHLIYAFGGFTKENTLKPFDKYQDIEKGGYAKFTGLKTYNPNLKTMIAIGGWNEGSSRFSSLVASSERRRELVKNAIKFMRQNKFDGLDLDWEYPAFRDGSKPKDKANYAKLVQELREEFEKESQATGRPRLLLTMAVPAGIEYIDKGYDVPKLNRYLDWMNILSYDFHSAFEPAVNHHAPLYPLEAASEYNYDSELNIDYTIKHYLEAGADRDKLVLGIPTYGRSYTLFNADSTAIGAPADGPGEQGEATREKGYLAYYEICEELAKVRSKRAVDDDDDDEETDSEEDEEEWVVVQPNPRAMGPYAFKGKQWVGYDDIDIVKRKAEYVAEKGLGGIMFWSIDNDDFRGKCHGKPYPLIEAAKGSLYKSLGITEKVASPPKKSQTSGKRTRPKPSSSDDEDKDISKNTIKNTKSRNRYSSDAVSESSISSSNRRRQNLKRTSTTEAPSEAVTPDWGLNTPEPPTTPDPGTDFKCEEEGFFPHPRDCKKYFWCLDSGPSNLGIVAHQFTCPSGLHFNKAADSCDFARNVLCKNKKPAATTKAPPVTKTTSATSTTTSTSAPRTTTAPTRISPQLANLFTTRRPLPKITAATSRTTLLSKPTSPSFGSANQQEEYDDDEVVVEEDVPDSEEDPKVIKELIDLIKKLGGVEQLEKYLAGTGNTQGIRITTPPTVSRLLYERVLSQFERAPPQVNSRGPQAAGLEKFSDSDKKSSRWEKPQYTTINRQRASTTTEESDVYEREPVETEEETRESPSSTVRTNLPQYVNIRRGRPSSTTDLPESTARNALYDRGSEEIDTDLEDVKNGVQGFEYSNIRRFRPETQESTTLKYKTIQRTRPTTTETILEDENDNASRFRTNNPIEISSQYVSTTEKPVQTSSKYSTVSRFPSSTNSPQIIETTTIHTRNNDITDSNDVNVEIASPSFASENGVVKNKDNSVLNAKISLLSNTVKPVDTVATTPSSVPYVSYSTEVTISEDPFYSTSKGTPLFVKRTRPTTTTTEKSETTTHTNLDKKVSFNRVYTNVRRTNAQNNARVKEDSFKNLEQDVVSSNDNVLDETNDNLIEFKVRSRVRKIRSTTPSSQENITESGSTQTDYGSRRTTRPQIRFGVQRFNPNLVLRDQSENKNIVPDDRLTTSEESVRKPTFRSRRLQTSTSSQRSEESRSDEEGEPFTSRPQPVRRYRPSLRDFGPDLSSLTALDSSRRNAGEEQRSNNNLRNIQTNRRFRPTFASTKPPLEDSEDSDSSITPVRTVAQRTFAPRSGRFTTVRTTSTESDLNEEASEGSIIPRGRKLSIARFTPRPFSRVTNEVLDEIDDTDAQEENDLAAEISFDSAPIGKARLTAPAFTVSEDSRTSSTASSPLPSINVTKVINSNILLGQSNNRSGILLLRRLSKPATNVILNTTTDHSENSEAIHLSESNIEEQEQTEDNALPIDRPRKRIIIKKTRPKVVQETENFVSAATEKIEITTSIISNDENKSEPTKDQAKPRIRKVLRRRPATSTTTESAIEETSTEGAVLSEADIESKNTTTPVIRRRKIIRKKLKPVVTDEGKARILQTKDEAIIDEDKNKVELEENETTVKLLDVETTTAPLNTTPENLQEITEQTTQSINQNTALKISLKTFEEVTTSEPSTTASKTFSRKYFAGTFTTPTSPADREISLNDRPRVETSPRRPVFNARPINRRPVTTPSTTTVDEEDYSSEEENEEDSDRGENLVFVPVDQLFTRGPPKPTADTIGSDDESEEEEENSFNQVSSTPRTINRFAPGRRPPLLSNRPSPARESNRPVNTPQGVRISEEGGRRFNRPIPFQPNRTNRFGTSATTAQTETTTRSYVRKFSPNRPQSDSFTTENINIEAVSAIHKQLFSNPKRFTTVKPSFQITNSDSDSESPNDISTINYDAETTTFSYDSETATENLDAETDEWLSSNDLTEEPVTDAELMQTESPDESTTIDPQYEITTVIPQIDTNGTEKVHSVFLDKLFSVSRVVEISSKEDKLKLNSKNETRLVKEGKIKIEKEPTLDKIGEVSRYTLIKIVEGDIPIYLTNLSHEYPVDNPPNNPIRIDEARNARALVDFSDSGKENLIASESVNAAYNHKNGVVELIQTSVDSDYKTDTDESGNKVYVIESTTVIDKTENPTESEPTEAETVFTTDTPTPTERLFVPGAIDLNVLKSNNVNVVTPKPVESSTIALEALFGTNDTKIIIGEQKEKTVSAPQPYVVYASPINPNELQTETTIKETNMTETARESSGRSIDGAVKVQVIQSEGENIKVHLKEQEFHGVPAALDVITEKGFVETTIANLRDNITAEKVDLSSTTVSNLPLTTTTTESSISENINKTSTETSNDSLMTETSMPNFSDDSLTTIGEITTEINEPTTITEQMETTTIIAETVKPILVKTLTSSIPINSTASKFAKNRPKLSFPRRYQSNSTNPIVPRVPFNPLNKAINKNRTLSTPIDSKNVPYTTPKYNRTNSYTSGLSRFSANRVQNVPVDTRKKLEANKFKPSTTTTSAPISNETKLVNVPVEPTTAKVTIRKFKPRISLFARRTSTTESPEQDAAEFTGTPSSIDNAISTEKQKYPSVRPTFFPRRGSNRFSNLNSERGRSTTPASTTVINEPSTARYSSLRKRPPSTFARRTTSAQPNETSKTESAEASTSRPNRLVVRKYYNNKRGGTQNNITDSTEASPTTTARLATSRKPFRVGVRRRLPSTTRATTTASITTVSQSDNPQFDQEVGSTLQRSQDQDSSEDNKVKKVKINKRPLTSNVNDLIQNSEKESSDSNNKEKVYSSVIKEDNTVVQQEVTRPSTGPTEGLIGSVSNEVTPDVALAAHQLLSAPLPTPSSYYEEEDKDFTTIAPEDRTFTRAYLLASISPPIISNDYLTTTQEPLAATAFSFPTRGRRISTTSRPQRVIYTSTFNQPILRRRPQTPAPFEKVLAVSPVTNHYRTVVDYEYYDDDDVRFVGNSAQQEKVILRGSGVIQCLDQGNFPHPKSCKKFISCAKMETGGVYGWEYTCPKGLSFDPVGGICNWSAGLGCNEH